MAPKAPYGEQCMWTIELRRDSTGDYGPARVCEPKPPESSYEDFDLAVIEVDDTGSLSTPSQLSAIADRVEEARRLADNGVIVVTFVHGWKNNARWDNANLASFRLLLQALMFREMEMHRRRVIGIYVGWDGDRYDGWRGWLARLPAGSNASFSNRYGVAGTIGSGEAVTKVIAEITRATKAPLGGVSTVSPLVFAGHSMGAFILQLAMVGLYSTGVLEYPDQALNREVARTEHDGRPVQVPDLVLSLNSAAESGVAEELRRLLGEGNWSRSVAVGHIEYHPPMMISVTSEADHATGLLWRVAKLGDRTDGHSPALATHSFRPATEAANCAPIARMSDFGQPWHCLHGPLPPFGPNPGFRVDLPTTWPEARVGEHAAFDLIPRDPARAAPLWIFQVPKSVIKDHGDIFNYQAASLTLALMQLAGVLASGAQDWHDTFA